MKVLHIIDFLNVGGAERVCITLCNLLHKTNFKVSVLLIVSGGDLKNSLNSEIPLIELNRKNKYNIFTMYKCACILKKQDVLHVHMRYNYRYIKLVQRLFFLNIKIILHDHYGNIDNDVSVPFGFANLFKPSFYIGVSKTLTDWAERQLKVSTSNIFLLPNIVVKKKTDNATRRKGFVLVGNIKPIKNQLFAIQLISKTDNTLTIYGNIHDENYFKLLKKEIKDLNLDKRVFFIHNCTRIQEELKAFEMGLQTAVSESGPLTLIEYLAQGTPFLTYNTGEVVNKIESDLPNLILDNFEINEWLKRIEKASRMNTMKLNTVFQKKFSKKTYIESCEKIYKKVSNQ